MRIWNWLLKHLDSTDRLGARPTDGTGRSYRLVDAYLVELDAALTVSARRRRRIVGETRDHLVETADRLEANGLRRSDAATMAIEGFGPASAIAREFEPRATVTLIASTIGLHLVLLGAAGLVTIGLSGALAGATGLVAGPEFVSGAAPEGLSAADCARLATSEPNAASCADAWSWHFVEETVLYRGVPGGLGLLIGIVALLVARQSLTRTAWVRRTTQISALAGALGFTALCAVASVLALGLEGDGVPSGVTRGGSGLWLSLVLATALTATATTVAYAATRRGVTIAS